LILLPTESTRTPVCTSDADAAAAAGTVTVRDSRTGRLVQIDAVTVFLAILWVLTIALPPVVVLALPLTAQSIIAGLRRCRRTSLDHSLARERQPEALTVTAARPVARHPGRLRAPAGPRQRTRLPRSAHLGRQVRNYLHSRPTSATCPVRSSISSTASTTRAWRQPGGGRTACRCTAARTPAAQCGRWSRSPPACSGGRCGRRSPSRALPPGRTWRPAGSWARCWRPS
jgi:hypothetical protein